MTTRNPRGQGLRALRAPLGRELGAGASTLSTGAACAHVNTRAHPHMYAQDASHHTHNTRHTTHAHTLPPDTCTTQHPWSLSSDCPHSFLKCKGFVFHPQQSPARPRSQRDLHTRMRGEGGRPTAGEPSPWPLEEPAVCQLTQGTASCEGHGRGKGPWHWGLWGRGHGGRGHGTGATGDGKPQKGGRGWAKGESGSGLCGTASGRGVAAQPGDLCGSAVYLDIAMTFLNKKGARLVILLCEPGSGYGPKCLFHSAPVEQGDERIPSLIGSSLESN